MKRRTLLKTTLLTGLLTVLAPGYANAGSDFFSAVRSDDANKVKALLAQGVDPNMLDANQQCALVIALQQDAFKVFDVLLADKRTQVNYVSPKGETPLMIAAIKGLLPQAQALITRGAHVNKTDWTPLHYAASQPDTAMIALMIENYAYIDAESPNQTTPLMMAARYGTHEGVQLLLEEGADPMLKNQQGMTAYDFALSTERSKTVELILQAMRAKQPSGW